MAIKYKKNVAVLEDVCEIEEAEPLLEWLLQHPKGKLNLKKLSHPHSAIMQLMMAFEPTISIWPEDEAMSRWLEPSLQENR